MSADTDFADAGYVVSSSYRTAVIRHLDEGPATPSTIEKETGISIAHVSRAIQELRDRGYVELLVPEERRKGRIYGATDRGHEAAAAVEELNGGDAA